MGLETRKPGETGFEPTSGSNTGCPIPSKNFDVYIEISVLTYSQGENPDHG
jgi:hypothetical protein